MKYKQKKIRNFDMEEFNKLSGNQTNTTQEKLRNPKNLKSQKKL